MPVELILALAYSGTVTGGSGPSVAIRTFEGTAWPDGSFQVHVVTNDGAGGLVGIHAVDTGSGTATTTPIYIGHVDFDK